MYSFWSHATSDEKAPATSPSTPAPPDLNPWTQREHSRVPITLSAESTKRLHDIKSLRAIILEERDPRTEGPEDKQAALVMEPSEHQARLIQPPLFLLSKNYLRPPQTPKTHRIIPTVHVIPRPEAFESKHLTCSPPAPPKSPNKKTTPIYDI